MLDKRGLTFLNLISSSCETSGYKIFSVNDLLTEMSRRFNMDEYTLDKYIEELSSRELISVRYQDDAEICLCLLPKGRKVIEEEREKRMEKRLNASRYLIYSFLGAFIGGLIATLIVFCIMPLFGV